ncbi:MAG: hypothetical protein U0S36_03460 [Candidatus Nanopelagicales bacterium]
MTPDGYDDVRVLLRELDPGPLPDLDVDAIVRGGELERRRRARSRWYAVAAVLVVVAAVGAGLLTLARPEAVGPAAPGGSSSPTPGTSSFRPTPYTPQQWLLYAQPDIDDASSVRVVEKLAPGVSDIGIDAVLGRDTAQGVLTVGSTTSRYVAVDGVAYVEPAALLALSLVTPQQVGDARWVRLGGERFRLPTEVRSAPGTALADMPHGEARFGAARTIDGTPATAIETQVDLGDGKVRTQTYYLATEPPRFPLIIELDGEEVARFSDWNAPVTTPVLPPASEVVTVPGL